MSDTSRTAVVTGGTRGIGAAVSVVLRDAGHRVIANYAGNDEAAAAFAEAHGVETRKWDVSDAGECERNLGAIVEEHGPVSILVNNAGITRDAMLHRMSVEAWDAVMRTNLDSLFYVTRGVIGGMRDQNWGRIVNLSSVNGFQGQIGQTNYAASKAGVIGFTKSLAKENARKGITVNAIAPGYINTEMVAKIPEKVMEDVILPPILMGRLGEVDEISRAVLFLVDENAGWITGSTLHINGGQQLV